MTKTLRYASCHSFAIALLLAVVGCSGNLSPAKKTDSLYGRLGGEAGITAVVDGTLELVAANGRINGFFAMTDGLEFRRLFIEQLCAATGGPCTYRGRDMKTTHAGRGISDAHFDALVQDLVTAMRNAAVPEAEQQELLALLAPMRSDIVER